jgi:hypothetical protein
LKRLLPQLAFIERLEVHYVTEAGNELVVRRQVAGQGGIEQ